MAYKKQKGGLAMKMSGKGPLPMASPMKNINNMKAYSKPGDAVQFGDAPTDMKAPAYMKSPLEAAKPDYIDIDKDGNTTESMKEASMAKMKSSGFKMKSGSPMKRNFGISASPIKVRGTHRTYLNPDGSVKNTTQVDASIKGTKPTGDKKGLVEGGAGGVLGAGSGPEGNYTKKVMVDGLDALQLVLRNPSSTSDDKDRARNTYQQWKATVGEEYAAKDKEIQGMLDSGKTMQELPQSLQDYYENNIKPNVIKGAEEGTSNVVPSDPDSTVEKRKITFPTVKDGERGEANMTVDGTQNLYQDKVREPSRYELDSDGTAKYDRPTIYTENDFSNVEDIDMVDGDSEGYDTQLDATTRRIAELEKGFSEGVTFPNDAKKELKMLKENLAKFEKQKALRDE
tara:strand:- start:118 stop:1311 length:1194 start_codon:yes stop_codon:yes gene_type:complete